MQKPTPTYRNDKLDGIPNELKEYLDKYYFENLTHLDNHNPKILVVFSGGNALGKSTLSFKIKQKLQGLVLENDEIKLNIKKYDPKIERETLNLFTWRYSMDLYSKLQKLTPNGLVIRDGVIDWYYDRILPIFEKQHYNLFIIGYNVSTEKRKELITKRGDKPAVTATRLIEIMHDHDTHVTRFRKEYTPDIMLTDNDLFDHDKVIAILREKIQRLQ